MIQVDKKENEPQKDDSFFKVATLISLWIDLLLLIVTLIK